MVFTPSWTMASTAQFERLHALNKSFADIAFELQRLGFTHITRNACVGKARRMKLHNGRTVGNYRDGVQNVGVKPKQVERKVERKVVIEPVEVMRPTIRNRTGLHFDLDADQCRWPMGAGPPFIFCTEDNNGGPYCSHHHARAFAPSR